MKATLQHGSITNGIAESMKEHIFPFNGSFRLKFDEIVFLSDGKDLNVMFMHHGVATLVLPMKVPDTPSEYAIKDISGSLKIDLAEDDDGGDN